MALHWVALCTAASDKLMLPPSKGNPHLSLSLWGKGEWGQDLALYLESPQFPSSLWALLGLAPESPIISSLSAVALPSVPSGAKPQGIPQDTPHANLHLESVSQKERVVSNACIICSQNNQLLNETLCHQSEMFDDIWWAHCCLVSTPNVWWAQCWKCHDAFVCTTMQEHGFVFHVFPI